MKEPIPLCVPTSRHGASLPRPVQFGDYWLAFGFSTLAKCDAFLQTTKKTDWMPTRAQQHELRTCLHNFVMDNDIGDRLLYVKDANGFRETEYTAARGRDVAEALAQSQSDAEFQRYQVIWQGDTRNLHLIA